MTEKMDAVRKMVERAMRSRTVEDTITARSALHELAADEGCLARGAGRCPGCSVAMDIVIHPNGNYGCESFCELCLQSIS